MIRCLQASYGPPDPPDPRDVQRDSRTGLAQVVRKVFGGRKQPQHHNMLTKYVAGERNPPPRHSRPAPP